MSSRWRVGLAALMAISACDFDRAYTGYCTSHPGACGVAGGDGGTHPGVGGVEISVSPDLQPLTCSTDQGLTGLRLSTLSDAGVVVGVPVAGSVVLTVGPSDGLALYAGEGCLGTPLGQYTEFFLDAGVALDRHFSMRAKQAGQFQVGALRSLPGFTEPDWKPVRVTGQLTFAGVPETAPGLTCLGPVAVVVLDPFTQSGLTVNADTSAQLIPNSSGASFHSAVGCGAPVTSVAFPADGGQSQYFWVMTGGAAGPASISVSGPAFGGTPVFQGSTANFTIAGTPDPCVGSGKPCIVGGVGCCTGSCAQAVGYTKCQ